jgi:peptide deformylase
MFELMTKKNGIGLAAPQVGLDMRLVIVSTPDIDAVAMVNPEIIGRSGSQLGAEGCLSFPGTFIEVERSEEVTVSYQDFKGKHKTLTAAGLFARCIQHELDHLDGVLFLDFSSESVLYN